MWRMVRWLWWGAAFRRVCFRQDSYKNAKAQNLKIINKWTIKIRLNILKSNVKKQLKLVVSNCNNTRSLGFVSYQIWIVVCTRSLSGIRGRSLSLSFLLGIIWSSLVRPRTNQTKKMLLWCRPPLVAGYGGAHCPPRACSVPQSPFNDAIYKSVSGTTWQKIK